MVTMLNNGRPKKIKLTKNFRNNNNKKEHEKKKTKKQTNIAF